MGRASSPTRGTEEAFITLALEIVSRPNLKVYEKFAGSYNRQDSLVLGSAIHIMKPLCSFPIVGKAMGNAQYVSLYYNPLLLSPKLASIFLA